MAAGVVAVATVVAHLPPAVVVAALAVIAGAVVVDMAHARRVRVGVERTDVPALARGTPVPFGLDVTVDGGQVTRLHQPAPAELALDPSEVTSASLGGSLTGAHRGTHTLPPMVVRVRGPLGLATSDHTGGPVDAVTVLPDLPRARRLAAARRRGRASDEGRIRNRLGLGTEFETIRDYSPDDDIRQVNWLATARVGRPMSNQFRIDENRDLVCMVDAGRLMASPLGDATRLDVALDALAVLAVAADDAGDRVGTVAFAASVVRNLPPRRNGAEPVVRALFDLEPMEVESDYDRAFQAVVGRKRALVALFTDLVDGTAARTLLAAVPVLGRHHALMVVSSTDTDLAAALRTPPADDREALRAVVALDLLASRRRTLGLLRRMGVTVVESGPDTLGPACASAYVRLKQSGRL